MSGSPSIVWMPTLGAEDVEQPRDDVDLDVEILNRADQSQRLVVGVVREGDDHALDVEQLNELAQLLRATEQRQVVEIVAVAPSARRRRTRRD